MTRDNPSIATNVNTITSSVIILSLGECPTKTPLSPFGETNTTMNSGAAELFSVRTCPVCIEDYFQPVFEVLRVRAIFSNRDRKITRSRVQNAGWLICFFPSTSQFLGSSARNLRRLSCGAM